MHKAISVIQFKVEGKLILQHPEFQMEERALLHRIDYKKGTILLDGKEYPLKDDRFPTIDPAAPYELTEEEEEIMAVSYTHLLLQEWSLQSSDVLFPH